MPLEDSDRENEEASKITQMGDLEQIKLRKGPLSRIIDRTRDKVRKIYRKIRNEPERNKKEIFDTGYYTYDKQEIDLLFGLQNDEFTVKKRKRHLMRLLRDGKILKGKLSADEINEKSAHSEETGINLVSYSETPKVEMQRERIGVYLTRDNRLVPYRSKPGKTSIETGDTIMMSKEALDSEAMFTSDEEERLSKINELYRSTFIPPMASMDISSYDAESLQAFREREDAYFSEMKPISLQHLRSLAQNSKENGVSLVRGNFRKQKVGMRGEKLGYLLVEGNIPVPVRIGLDFIEVSEDVLMQTQSLRMAG